MSFFDNRGTVELKSGGITTGKYLSYLDTSLTVFREEIDATSYLIAHQNLARTYILLSHHCNLRENLYHASEHIEKCQKHYEIQDHSVNHLKINLHYTEVLTDLADTEEKLPMLVKAEAILLNLLKFTEKLQYELLTAEPDYNLARVYYVYYRLTKEYDYIEKGLAFVNQSLYFFTLQDCPLKYARSVRLLAALYALTGSYDSSRKEYENALQVFTLEQYPELYHKITEEILQTIR